MILRRHRGWGKCLVQELFLQICQLPCLSVGSCTLCSATILSRYGKDRAVVVITENPDADSKSRYLLVKEKWERKRLVNTSWGCGCGGLAYNCEKLRSSSKSIMPLSEMFSTSIPASTAAATGLSPPSSTMPTRFGPTAI